MSDDPNAKRRHLVLGAAAAAGLSALGVARSAVKSAKTDSLTDLSASEAVARMSRGELSCERYAQALIERCRAAKALNAFIAFEPEQVLGDARARDRERRGGKPTGLLFGLPIPVKDSVNTADYPTSGGTPALRHFRPKEDAPLVAALRAAGAIVLGKTNLHELSYGWTSNNLAFGAVHNPYDVSRIPGGSSGGTGAAIAARCAPLGIAEDTEGSIRVPAAFCGVHGFRPSTGRYSTKACVPISPLFDQAGPHARSVRDLMLFDTVAATAPSPPQAPISLHGARLGIVRDYFYAGLDPEVERITSSALERLKSAGAVMVEAPMAGLARLIGLITDQVQNHDVRIALPKYLSDYAAGVTLTQLLDQASPDIQATFKSDVMPGGANFVSEAAFLDARDRYRPELQQLYRDFFKKNRIDALVFPATRVPPPRIGEETTVDIGGQAVPFEDAVARNIAPGSTAGIPGLVLPAGLTASGLPVALEFDGPAGADLQLLVLGEAIEPVLGPIAAPRI